MATELWKGHIFGSTMSPQHKGLGLMGPNVLPVNERWQHF